MNDDFLHDLRREPRPAFARDLRERLIEEDELRRDARRRFRTGATWAAAAAVVVVAFAFPAVRASAQAVLELFRVRTFAAVKFDPARLERLPRGEGDRAMMVFERRDVLREPGEPRVAGSLAEAGTLAGLSAVSPTELPAGWALDSVRVTGEAEAELVLSGERLRTMLDALELRDVRVPANLDGRPVHVRMPPAILTRYVRERSRLLFVQSSGPEVQLPPGADLAQVGELGLRVLGLSEAEARRMARRVDWANTLVVPVPTDAASFREVTVAGRPGLLVTTADRDQGAGRKRAENLLLWSTPDRVLALQGTLEASHLVRVAESVR